MGNRKQFNFIYKTHSLFIISNNLQKNYKILFRNKVNRNKIMRIDRDCNFLFFFFTLLCKTEYYSNYFINYA